MQIIRGCVVSLVLLSLLLADGGAPARAEDAASQTVLLPMIGKRMCNGTVAPTPFGVQMYGGTGGSSPYFEELMDSRATWVRVPVAWRNVEPVNTNQANFKWASADAALAVAGDGCLNVIATHRWAPEWAADSPDGPVHANDLDDLAEYLAALVERYDGDGIDDAPGSPVVRYWELYNEPDAVVAAGGWGDEAERYADLLKIVRPAIWNASQDAKVLIGGLAYDWFEDDPVPGVFRRAFLEDVVNAGGGDKFDIMNIHYFPDFASNWAQYGPGLIGKTRAIRQEMERLGLQQRHIMVTEASHYADNRPPMLNSSEELHMRYVVVLSAQAKAAGVETLIWFTLYDLDGYIHKTGLVTSSTPPRRRSAFYAYRFVDQMLSGAEYRRKLGDAETGNSALEVHRFHDPVWDRPMYVAWRYPLRTDATLPLSLPGEVAVVRDVFGGSTTVRDGHDGTVDGKVRVTVSGRPIYVQLR